MSPNWLAPLTWAWAIIVGGALLIPPGVIVCIRCGPSAPAYIGDLAVIVIALVSIALGVLGFADRMRRPARPPGVAL